jgi:alpha-tubulin suppressor-like RCC1 family protein
MAKRSRSRTGEDSSDLSSAESDGSRQRRKKRSNSVAAAPSTRLLLATPKRNQRARSATPRATTPTRTSDRTTPALTNLLPLVGPSQAKGTALLVFGDGSMAQFGMGVNALHALPEPTRHDWFDEVRQQDPSFRIEDVSADQRMFIDH